MPEALDPDARARVRCVHEHAATDVEADVTEPEEQEVAGAEAPAPDAPAGRDLPARVVRQGDSEWRYTNVTSPEQSNPLRGDMPP